MYRPERARSDLLCSVPPLLEQCRCPSPAAMMLLQPTWCYHLTPRSMVPEENQNHRRLHPRSRRARAELLEKRTSRSRSGNTSTSKWCTAIVFLSKLFRCTGDQFKLHEPKQIQKTMRLPISLRHGLCTSGFKTPQRVSLDLGTLRNCWALVPNVYQSPSIASEALDSLARECGTKDREQTQEILRRNKKTHCCQLEHFRQPSSLRTVLLQVLMDSRQQDGFSTRRYMN